MIDFDAVILDLERTRLRPGMYVDPLTPESLVTYLSGLERGTRLSTELLTIDDYIDVRQDAIEAVGARRSAMHLSANGGRRAWKTRKLLRKYLI